MINIKDLLQLCDEMQTVVQWAKVYMKGDQKLYCLYHRNGQSNKLVELPFDMEISSNLPNMRYWFKKGYVLEFWHDDPTYPQTPSDCSVCWGDGNDDMFDELEGRVPFNGESMPTCW